MTAPVYTVNGSITFYGVRSSWQRVPKRVNSDGTTDWQPYLINSWDIAQAEMSSYEALRALQGAALTSLATNAVEDRNNGDTYTDVELSLVNGSQVGRRITNVHLEFRVKV